MKVSELTTDLVKVEQGAWVDKIPEMEGLRLKVRGTQNKDWRKLQQRLLAAVPRKQRIGGQLDPAAQDRILSICLLNCCLLDWEGLEDESDKPLLYSKAKAEEFLTDLQFGRFRDAVIWAASVVAEQQDEAIEEDAGNSSKRSAGTKSGAPV